MAGSYRSTGGSGTNLGTNGAIALDFFDDTGLSREDRLLPVLVEALAPRYSRITLSGSLAVAAAVLGRQRESASGGAVPSPIPEEVEAD